VEFALVVVDDCGANDVVVDVDYDD